MDAWKRRLMEVKALEGDLKHFTFFETGDVLHELTRIWYDSLSVKESAAISHNRVNTNQDTNVPPPTMPCDCMIDPDWWINISSEWNVKDWKTYGNPPELEPYIDLPLKRICGSKHEGDGHEGVDDERDQDDKGDEEGNNEEDDE
ncbi:hypothetical protein JB92DRAFT_3117641 [Gautieria morchelliformis]|nr:hypothetical protein JB92DRAFT_3117641 [Gautieria morchelliformis]